MVELGEHSRPLGKERLCRCTIELGSGCEVEKGVKVVLRTVPVTERQVRLELKAQARRLNRTAASSHSAEVAGISTPEVLIAHTCCHILQNTATRISQTGASYTQ